MRHCLLIFCACDLNSYASKLQLIVTSVLKYCDENSCHLIRVVLVPWGGVRLSPLGTAATLWPIVPAPDDHGTVGGMRIGRGNYGMA
jgi:hypothetical protein